VGTDPDLRILILSTPKTGNTWLRHLLAGVYRLPQFYVPPPLDCAKLDKAGERWVTHYHTRPNRELLSWIRTNRAVVVTTIRHPGDVLLSLYHHIHEFRNETLDHNFLRRMVSTGFERRGMTTYAADQPFSADLDCSLEWMAYEGTHTVRFEDLRADPVATLRELTSRIHPAPLERMEAAVEMCDIDVMRRMAGDFSGFFRQGRIGDWHARLPPDVVEVFRKLHPYAAQMARLGYSMDPVSTVPAGRVPPRRHPMTTLERFENGVAVAPIMVQCFFWAGYQQREAWEKQLAATGPGSFYHWLNLPAPLAGRGLYETLPLSNIAAFVYQQRPDVQLVYKDLSSGERYEYVRWFLQRAGKAHGLDAAFIDRQRAYLLRWANAGTPVGGEWASNFVAHICRSRIDVLGSFPHIAGGDRKALVRAVVRAAKALEMDRDYIRPLEASLGRHWLPERMRRRCGVD
jgi:hypothetical protein